MYTIFALVRFSFLGSDNEGYGRTKRLSFNEKKEVLFAEQRLHRRFELFEQVCLPSLAAQASSSFCAIILASDLMPNLFKARLEEMLSTFPNLLPVFEGPQPFPYTEVFLKHLRDVAQLSDVVLTCRLDDDDALGSQYTQEALKYVDSKHIGYSVSFPRGLQAARVRGEPRFWESYYPLVAAGLGYIHRSQSDETIYTCKHHQRVWRNFPTIVDGRNPNYLLTLHDENDSTSRRSWKDLLLRRPRHPNPHRNPPDTTYSLDQVRNQFGDVYASLRSTDWEFL